MVSDLVTFENMAQRFGRLNRFGEREDSEVDVVHPESFDEANPVEVARQKTLDLLRELSGNASPNALRRLKSEKRSEAFRPEPTILPITDILFDTWALTTITDRLPGRPSVEPYLHGMGPFELPETRIAWREEVNVIQGSLLEIHPPGEVLDDYPIKSWEMLRDKSWRAFSELKKMAERNAESPIWIVNSSGDVEVSTLAQVVKNDDDRRIQHCLLLLPPKAGGLTNSGLFDGSSDESVEDVSGEALSGQKLRCRVWNPDEKPKGMRLIREIKVRNDEEGESPDAPEAEVVVPQVWRWYEDITGGDSDGSKYGAEAVSLTAHTGQVTKYAETIARRLALPTQEVEAIKLAAQFHDSGKARKSWQRSIGNRDLNRILAKSGPDMTPVYLGDNYRHEFGSILDLQSSAEFKSMDEASQDLALHLIACHHGRGRPHFPAEEIFDPENTWEIAQEAAVEVPRRFARLQRKFGRWGLAHMESILRAADYAASARPESEVTK
jgi:CRISPR-associated endonuclease/helicase Cas3